ncbi:MAG TPA: MCP four helix bundle domain-containing protein, partial [bacterium]|nr:MCP four helix bundle domain-containing protein [bacterium]
MKLTGLKIGNQLKIGFAVILLFVAILGGVSYFQNYQIHQQTEIMYEHPLQVRRALWEIKGSVLNMRMNIRDFLLIEDEPSRQAILNEIALNKSHVFAKIETLRKVYLGPSSDIDDFSREFTKWVAIRDESIRIAAAGKLDEARARHQLGGIAPAQAAKVIGALEKISLFSLNKAEELHKNSQNLSELLNKQLGVLVGAILLFSILLMFGLLRNIRGPLNIIMTAIQRFRNGDMSVRSSYESGNEFGVLSESFNSMAESVQINNELDQKFANLAKLMLSKYDPKEFFQETINTLALHTGSQMAAVYLLSEDKESFNHFESTGIDSNAKQSFSAIDFEGEFGSAIFSAKIQHIKNIAENTRFVFHTVSGKFIPNEIITIPIIADKEIFAIISLASIGKYSSQSIKLIDNIFGTLCARVEGILAYHKIQDFLEKLKYKNHELEAQKQELSSQASELTEQNVELEMQKKQLDEANRLKTSFLSNMSHELRTPLNSVIALSGVLNRRLKDKVAPEEYGYIDVIERNGKNLLLLINDILDLSRIEAGRENIDIREFSPCELLREVVEMITPQAVEKNITLKTDCDKFIPSIWSDYEKCRHILQNIVANAVKFTDEGGVEISVIHQNENIQISVTDTGIGIEKDFIPHIFDEFRQADGSNSKKYGGTGLGMAIAKKYSEMLGGTISIESTPGKGSC